MSKMGLARKSTSCDIGVAILSFRSWALWLVGYPEAALADADHAVKDAGAIGQAVTLMYALAHAQVTHIHCGNHAVVSAQASKLVTLADEKGALPQFKAAGMMFLGSLSALAGEASDAIRMITSGITAWRSTGSTLWVPMYLLYLSRAYAELDQLNDAWRCIGEAMTAVETTKERMFEAEIYRLAGDIALMSSEPNVAKAEAYFERALAVAREQQAKSRELRAAMSMARLWRDQGKRQRGHDLLAPVYGWFTEGFDTLDLKEAKALLEQLKA